MATLLFLGASVSQVPAIRHARATNHRVVACDGDRNAVGFQDVDIAHVVDFNDEDAVTRHRHRDCSPCGGEGVDVEPRPP